MLVPTPAANPFRYLAQKSDEEQLAAFVASIEAPQQSGVRFPTFPPAEFQMNIHGHSGEVSLREAFSYFRACRRYIDERRGGFKPGDRLLDFGSGWGRILRPYMPYLDLDKIIGIEPNERIVRIAREHNAYVSFVEGAASAPSPFADNHFDLVTAWSVFSHLPQHIARSWLEEFGRICRPGALLFLTTWGDRFLTWLVDDAAKQARGEDIHWYRADVLKRIGDIAETKRSFDAGEFVWIHQHEHYGEALIPAAAMRALLPPTLELIESNIESVAQTVHVIRRV